jgi:recombination protein RecT
MSEIAARPKYEMAVIEAKPMFIQCSDEKTWSKEVGFAMQILRGNDVLQKCDLQSIKNAVVNVSLTGISLNPALALAYLVPRDGKCVLDISYRGMIKVGTDSGSVKGVQANVVYTFDEFYYEEGTNQRIDFKRNMDPPEDFKKDPLGCFWKYLLCVYSIATMYDGGKDYMIMPKWRIEKIKASSKAKSDRAPWGQWPEEMTRKTVIKYHYKTLPQTERMAQAVAILNEHEGLDERVNLRTDSLKEKLVSRLNDAEGIETAVIDAEHATADSEVAMTPEEEAAERLRLIAEFGTETEKKQAGLFTEE